MGLSQPTELAGIRLCMAAVSNFITLLRVQAPSVSRAVKARSLWKLWLGSLQRQHNNTGSLFMLSLVRLSSWPLEDLDTIFQMPAYISEAAIGASSPVYGNQNSSPWPNHC